MSRNVSLAVMVALMAVSAQAQTPTATPATPAPGGPGPGRNPDAGQAGNLTRSPEVGDDRKITFRLQAANAKAVQVFGDFTKDLAGVEMTKDENGVWSVTTEPLKPSYYQYWFVMDGLKMPDPLNTFVRPASGVYKSQVAVPGPEAEFMTFRDVPHGNLTEHFYLNQENKTSRRVVIYTPPDYSSSGKSYPVLYLLHGANDYERGWTQAGMANVIMDNLIADGKAAPAIIVMPFGHDTTGSSGKQPEIKALQASLGYVSPARGARGVPGAPLAGTPTVAAAPGAAPASRSGPSYMEKDLLGNVIPYVEKEFRVLKDKEHRAIFGYSMGGGHSTTIGFGHPELFAYVAGFSGYAGATSPTITTLLADPAKTNKDYKIIFIGSGTEDPAVNGGRTLHAAFQEKGINHIWSEDPGYHHDYQIWRIYLHTLLQKTFRD